MLNRFLTIQIRKISEKIFFEDQLNNPFKFQLEKFAELIVHDVMDFVEFELAPETGVDFLDLIMNSYATETFGSVEKSIFHAGAYFISLETVEKDRYERLKNIDQIAKEIFFENQLVVCPFKSQLDNFVRLFLTVVLNNWEEHILDVYSDSFESNEEEYIYAPSVEELKEYFISWKRIYLK